MLTLVAAVTLAQLSTTSTPGVGAAYSAYEHCMLEAAKNVDDYISDANTIAQAILFGRYCGSEFSAYQRLSRQGEDADIAATKELRHEMALLMVLVERRQKTTSQTRPMGHLGPPN